MGEVYRGHDTRPDDTARHQAGAAPLANYIESFKEVKIAIASNSAESAGLGQVTIVSKSGTNRFAGVVFDR